MRKRKKHVPTIGLLASSLYDQYQEEIWTGIQSQAATLGARVLCFAGGILHYPNKVHKSRNALYNLISSSNVDALVILSGSIGVYTGNEGIIQLLEQCPGIPAVSIGADIPKITSIIVDNEIGMRNLVFHMIQAHNCKRIAFINGPEKNDEAVARFNAYKQTLAENNILFDPDLVSPGDFEEKSGLQAVQLLIDKRKLTFDALIGVDDRSILFAMEPLKQRGFTIPADLKIAGFDDIENSQCSFPPLTTVRQPLFELGSLALKSAVELLDGKKVPHIQKLPTSLIIRSSCGCSPLEMISPLSLKIPQKPEKKRKGDNLFAVILSELNGTYSLHLFSSEKTDLLKEVKVLLAYLKESINKPSSETKLIDSFKETILQFHDKRFSFSMWKGLLTGIFQKLSQYFTSDEKRSVIDSLRQKLLLSLHQIELQQQTHHRINFVREIELIERTGDRLISSFNLEEIKEILTDSLRVHDIHECYISTYEKDFRKAKLIYCFGNTTLSKKQGAVFPSQHLVPGQLPSNKCISYSLQPLISEHEQFGFVLLELRGKNGYLYETLSEKIASALNGAKLAEEIKRQNIALRESESEDLRITLNSIGDAMIATNADMNITRMNPMAEELTGHAITNAFGQPLLEIFRVQDAAIRNEVKKSLKKTLTKGQVVGTGKDIVLIAKEGAERHIHYSGAPIRNVDGDIMGIVLIFRDITEQMRLEEQLRHSQKMDSIGQLAGGVAHDFNNMLFGISGAAELISKIAGKNKEVIKFAGTIMDATQRAADLTQKLLAFSRKAKVQSTLLDVHSCIVQALQILLHTIDRRIKIANELNAEISTINGDPTQIQNLVLNLGLNARDAMPNGGELTISTANVTLNKEYCRTSLFDIEPCAFMEISVRDTGSGMNKQTQERMFDPFFTTKDVGKGTGLGLAAVYGIVRDHKGALEVQSKLKKGTVFKVYLPLVEGTTGLKKEDTEKVVTGTGCVLVIDDESIVRSTLEGLLKDLGYSVILAEDGEHGVATYKKSRTKVDCIILDMVMPKMNGVDAFYAIRKINPAVKIILSSGFSQDADVEKLKEHGALAFIQKPFRRAELSRVLAESLK